MKKLLLTLTLLISLISFGQKSFLSSIFDDSKDKEQIEIEDYSILEGLYSAEVESILGKPDVIYNGDEFNKVYFYKEILETHFGKEM